VHFDQVLSLSDVRWNMSDRSVLRPAANNDEDKHASPKPQPLLLDQSTNYDQSFDALHSNTTDALERVGDLR
jgi:hypothetical protein